MASTDTNATIGYKNNGNPKGINPTAGHQQWNSVPCTACAETL
jgi:hypothetical protein